MNNKWNLRFLLKPIFFIAALLCGIYLVLYIEKLRPSDFGFYKDIFSKEIIIERADNYPLRKTGEKLSAEEKKYAEIAWQFFENNYNDSTGFVNSVQYYPSTTLWDVASYLHAICSAYELQIIDSTKFQERMGRILSSMSTMKLYDNRLPNKVYNTQTLQMTNYGNAPVEKGVGWSAMDIGRFFSCVNRIIIHYPQFTEQLKSVITRWKIDDMIIDGTMHGIMFSTKDHSVKLVQEGKLGYEEYAAKGLMMMGYDVHEALLYTDFLKFVRIYGIDIGVDTREVKYYPAYNYVLSEPYILDGIEYGFDVNSRELAWRVFRVQQKRFENTGILTAVSEDHVDQEPYFIYNAVYANTEKWNCVSESGDPVPDLKQLSTKAAFGWYVLFDTPYSKKLFDSVKDLYDEENGWYAGRYEKNDSINKAITANTNGIILECLNYKLKGAFVRL